MDAECEVLVVGAGPTGLTLATLLKRSGIACLVIDKASGPSRTSKAIGLQYRVSEILAWLGLLPRFEARAAKQTRVNLLVEGQVVTTLQLGQLAPAVSGAFAPRPIILPQSDTEELLGAALVEAGGLVHFGTELVGLTQNDDQVEARLADGSTIRARYLLSCEGGHSVARKLAGIAFEGKTYPHDFIMADVAMESALRSGEAHSFLHPDGVLTAITMPGEKRWRLFIEAGAADVAEVSLDTIRALYVARTGDRQTTISDPTWLTRFKIHSRIVDHYRAGRVFLAGDAAHLHSPSGGQGITTGMQDATNLAWKLAHVLRHGAPEELLDSYEEERRPAAQAVLRATDRNTNLLFARGRFAKWFRDRIFLPLLATAFVQRRLVRRMSQLDQGYRGTSLARAVPRTWRHGLIAGDRAPDVILRDGASLFSCLGPAPLALLAQEEPVLTRCLARLGIAVAVLGPAGRRVYGGENELWLLRPDGYIAYRGALSRPEGLVRLLSRFYSARAVHAAFRDLAQPLSRRDKLLYHQIHPLKLFVDFASSFWSTWLLWQQSWSSALLVGLVPSLLITALLVGFSDLRWLCATPLGRYLAQTMTRKIEALRFAGQIAMWCGAAVHVPWLIPLGLFVVLMAWGSGLWSAKRSAPTV